MTDEALPRASYDADLTGRLRRQRTVLLAGELDTELGARICADILLLSGDDPRSDIWLWIDSPGGSVTAMLAIRDVMTLVPNDVATVGLGMAYSAGQFLLSAGTPGKRYLMRHAKVLLHQGSAGIGGTAEDIAIQAGALRQNRDTVLALIAQDTGQPVDVVERDSRRDRWFGAPEALAYGFVDHVVSSVEQIRPPKPQPLGLAGAR